MAKSEGDLQELTYLSRQITRDYSFNI